MSWFEIASELESNLDYDFVSKVCPMKNREKLFCRLSLTLLLLCAVSVPRVTAETAHPRAFNVLDLGAVGGDINYWVVEGNVGATEKFARKGGASIRARSIGSAKPGI